MAHNHTPTNMHPRARIWRYPCGTEAKNEVVRYRGKCLYFLQCTDIEISIFKTRKAQHSFGYGGKGQKEQECICIPGSCGQMYGHGLQVWVSGSQCKADEEDISSLPSRLLCACVHPCVAVCVGGCVRVFWTRPSRWWDTILIQWHGRWQTVPPASRFGLQDRAPHHLTDQSAHTHSTAHSQIHTSKSVSAHIGHIYFCCGVESGGWSKSGSQGHSSIFQPTSIVEIWKMWRLYNINSITAGMWIYCSDNCSFFLSKLKGMTRLFG